MIEVLAYANQQGEEFFTDTKLTFGSMPIEVDIAACTIAGSSEKLNEDAYAIYRDQETLLLGVFDGVTSLKPISRLEEKTGAWFASHMLRDHISSIDKETKLTQGLISINKKLLELNIELGGSLDDTHSLPATMATVMRINFVRNEVELGHVGDSFVVMYFRDGSSQVVTNNLNNKFDSDVLGFMGDLARQRKISQREARQLPEVKQKLYEMFVVRNNNPNGSGSGVLNGDPNVDQYIQGITFSLSDVRGIFIGSDGIVPVGWSLNSPDVREYLLSMSTGHGLQQLVEEKHRSENSDPDWCHLRYKHSDDATAIVLVFKRP